MRGRFGHALVASTVGLLVLAAGASQAAQSHPGAVLDPTFGYAGIVRLPSEPAFDAYGTAAQGGDLLVSGGAGIEVLNDLGGTGEAFGGVGSVDLPPANGREFRLGAITVDPQGRLLVVGTSLFPESGNPSPFEENGARAFRPGVVRILRFLPDGLLDPTFGQGGVVETGLGLPPPRGTGRRRLGSHPAVGTTGIVVDRRGGIVVTGDAVVRLGETCHHDSFAPAAVSAGFVARLTESGAPDSGFGRDGLVGGRSISETPLGATAIWDPVVGPTGAITYWSSAYTCEDVGSRRGIARLTPEGRTSRAFGRKGVILGPYHAIAGEPDGSVVALAEVPRRREKESFRARVIRITPDGKRDDAFGRDGQATVKLGPGFGTSLDSLAVDGQGRILVGGTLEARKGRSIVLLRVSAGGRWQRNFGPRGRVATRVPRLNQFGASGLFFDPQGRLVTVHLYTEPLKASTGLVVARYLLRN